MQKKNSISLLCAAGFSLGLAGLAHAADQNSDSVSVCGEWSGVYVGGHAGYIQAAGDGQASVLGLDATIKSDGFAGGPLLGANYQADCTVFSIEGDVGFGNVKGFDANIDLPGNRDGVGVHGDINGHIRGRLGYSFGEFMPFVAGGLAITKVTLSTGYGSDSNSHVGFTLGGGIDWAATDNVVVRAEYLYDNYASKTYAISDIDVDGKFSTHTIRGALIWKF